MDTFFEYVVKPPKGYKKTKRRKISLIIFYILFCAALIGISLVTPIINRFLAPIIFIVAAACFTVYLFTWPKTRPEYEYAIELGTFRLSVIYGGKIRRKLLETELRKAELIAPNNGMYESKIKDFAPKKEYSGAFSLEQKNYFMLFKNDKDEKSILYFSANIEQMLKFKKYNARTVIDRSARKTDDDR